MKIRNIMILVFVLFLNRLAGIEYVSPRIMALGKHLSFFVVDANNDVFHNPANITLMNNLAAVTISSFGNSSTASTLNTVRKEGYFLGITTNYSNDSNVWFFPYKNEKKWNDARYNTSYYNSNKKMLENLDYFNNNTFAENDDYTIHEISKGIYYEKYLTFGKDFQFSFIYGKEKHAFQYEFSAGRYYNPPEGRQYAYYLIERSELGENSPEAYRYEFEEVNNYQNIRYKHLLTYSSVEHPSGIFGNFVLGIWFVQNMATKHKKKTSILNYDPDNDDVLSKGSYKDKSIFSERQTEYDLCGFGGSFQFHKRKRISKYFSKISALELGLEFLNSSNFKQSHKEITYYNQLNEYTGEESTEVIIDEIEERLIDRQNYTFDYSFGYLVEFNKFMKMAMGVKIYLEYSLMHKDVDIYFDCNDISEDGLGGIVFPAGIEFTVLPDLSFQTGINYHSIDIDDHILSGIDYSMGTSLKINKFSFSCAYFVEQLYSDSIMECLVSYSFN